MTREEHSVVNNLVANISAAHQVKNLDVVGLAHCFAKDDRVKLGLHPFDMIGSEKK